MKMIKCLQFAACLMALVTAPMVVAGKEDVSEENFSGFLGNYDSLQLNEKQNAYRWANKDKLLTYKKIYLQPVVVYPSDQVNADIAIKATQHLAKGIQKILDELNISTDEKAEDVLQLRAAITGASKQKIGMKAYNFVPVALVFRAGKAATGNVDTFIDVSLEAELLDSQSGERVLATVLRGIGETEKTSGDQFEYEDTIPVLDQWLLNFETYLKSIF
jgi:hypothetical protein